MPSEKVNMFNFLQQKKFISGVGGLLFFGFLFFNINSVQAITTEVPVKDEKNYSAKFVSQSTADPITIEAGESATVVFKFKNVGASTWKAGGNFISAYTMEPKYHSSKFMGKGWISEFQTNKITTDVKPGEIGELKVNFVAPDKPGDYQERYYLAAENYTWMRGGYFYIKFKVLPKTKIVKTNSNTVSSTSTVVYKANRTLLNATKPVSSVGGQPIKIILGYQNLGKNTWQGYKISAGSATLASTGLNVSLTDSSWQDQNTILSRQSAIGPDEFWRETFYLRAPAKVGSYRAMLVVSADNQTIGEVEIPITVTADAPANYTEPTNSSNIPAVVPRLAEEPRIRVGLWKPEDGVVHFISYEDEYRILAGGEEKGVLNRKKFGILRYKNGVYSFEGDGINFTSSNYIRLEPVNDPHAVFVLNNFERKVTWKGPSNFNEYRGVMELRLTQDASALYVINDLFLEDYVAGDGETSNVAPIEYIKTMQVAYRTYAYYIKEQTDKHDKRNFDVVANTGDQLYLGHVSEELMPRVVEAAQGTRGYMVTYNNEIVITPYYANSDGRTRAWTEVWGGTTKPWLVSVKAEYDKGKKIYGHGVGISARDAAERADAEGVDWQYLLKYYYTGTIAEKVYR